MKPPIEIQPLLGLDLPKQTRPRPANRLKLHAEMITREWRAKREDRLALAARDTENLVYGALFMNQSVDADKDPEFAAALDQFLQLHKDRAEFYIRRTGYSKELQNLTLAKSDALIDGLVDGKRWLWAGILAAGRFKTIERKIAGDTSVHAKAIRRACRLYRLGMLDALDPGLRGRRVSKVFNNAMKNMVTSASVIETLYASITYSPMKEQTADLVPIVEAHQRAFKLKNKLPVFTTMDSSWLQSMDLYKLWMEKIEDGQIRGCCWASVIILGPDMTAGALRSAAKGQLNVGLTHEQLHGEPYARHCVGSEKPLENCDMMLMEGSNDLWAYRLCQRSRDPQTGLTGASSSRYSIGWQSVVEAIAQRLQRDQLELAKEIVCCEPKDRLRTLTEWLLGTNDDADVERVQQTLLPLQQLAWQQRKLPGAYRREILEQAQMALKQL